MGGPCDLAFHAETADLAIKMQDKHLKEIGDTLHAQALADMLARWRHPFRAMGWYNQVKSDFKALPKK